MKENPFETYYSSGILFHYSSKKKKEICILWKCAECEENGTFFPICWKYSKVNKGAKYWAEILEVIFKNNRKADANGGPWSSA